MKRALLVAGVALLFLGCQDSQVGPPEGPPDFAVSDGAHQDQTVPGNHCAPGNETWPQCQSFYFFPPIVPTPAFNGNFNAQLRPTIVVSELPSIMVPDPDNPGSEISVPDDSQPYCVAMLADGSTNIVRTFAPGEIAVDPVAELYSVGWQTGQDNLQSETGYRICTQLQRAGSTTPLGYRDVKPEDTNQDNRSTDQSPIYEFNNGSNIPIKFRIEKGALCFQQVGNEIITDCTEAILANGETAICDDATCAFQLGDNSLGEGQEELFFIRLVECPRADPNDPNSQITHLGVETDVPLVPACFEVDSPDFAGSLTFTEPAIAAMCLDESAAAAVGITTDQFDLLQGIHRREDAPGNFVVEAVPNVPFTGLDCAGFVETASAGSSNPLVNFAMKGLRKVQQAVAPWLNPPPLKARDSGFGNALGGESPLVWGLPVQMERGQIVDGAFVAWTDQEIGAVGETITPAVRVVDGGDADCVSHSDGCFVQSPARGATIWFDVTGGGGSLNFTGVTTRVDAFSNETKVVTGPDGIAQVGWTLEENNPNTLDAVGIGIGCVEFDDEPDGSADCRVDGFYVSHAPTDGSAPNPPSTDGTGTFGDNRIVDAFTRVAVDFGTGITEFEALACPLGPTVDGMLDDVALYQNSATFMAQLAGGEVPATVYWTNDCDNLYVALQVQSTDADDNVSLRVVFDNMLDGPDANDDVLFLLKEKIGNGKNAVIVWNFTDNYLSSGCLSSGQSSCAEPDPVPHGQGAFGTNVTWGVYEISHPLKTPAPEAPDPFDFQLDFGEQTGFFIALQLGNGSKGNTEWPDFRDYQCAQVSGSGDMTCLP